MPKKLTADTNKSYRLLQAELETIIVKLQGADVDVDEAVELFAAGQKKIEQLQEKLQTSKNKVKKMTGN